jgi:hypothetical protein
MPLVISKPNPDGSRDVLVILGRDSVERILHQDPFELEMWRFQWKNQVRTIQVTAVNEEEMVTIEKLLKEDNMTEAINIAVRGWQYRPDMGDHDYGYKPL